jgi:hypothetical protein
MYFWVGAGSKTFLTFSKAFEEFFTLVIKHNETKQSKANPNQQQKPYYEFLILGSGCYKIGSQSFMVCYSFIF